jgi:hypothetical protein
MCLVCSGMRFRSVLSFHISFLLTPGFGWLSQPFSFMLLPAGDLQSLLLDSWWNVSIFNVLCQISMWSNDCLRCSYVRKVRLFLANKGQLRSPGTVETEYQSQTLTHVFNGLHRLFFCLITTQIWKGILSDIWNIYRIYRKQMHDVLHYFLKQIPWRSK